MKDRFWGFSVHDDFYKEEKTYIIGAENEMPISLFLLLNSGMKEPIARYCSLITYTEQAIKWEKEFNIKELEKSAKLIEQEFDTETPFLDKAIAFHIKNMSNPETAEERHRLLQEEMNNQSRDIVLPLHLYANQFARNMAQKTVAFRTLSEGVIMTCPPSYIGYWNREEFKSVEKAIDNALHMIMEDVLRILKLKGIKHNEYNMTIHAPGYESKKFVVSYSW